MVSNRCKTAVKEILKALDLHFIIVDLGEVDIMESLTEAKHTELKAALLTGGFELMDDRRAVLVEKIKTAVVEMVHHSNEGVKINFSNYLSDKLGHNYTYLSNLFSEVQGATIEQFLIAHKIERIKELILYGELNISEIAWKMHYSSVAHLSNQFKKVTGLSPTNFKQLRGKKRSPIEHLTEQLVSQNPAAQDTSLLSDNLPSNFLIALQEKEAEQIKTEKELTEAKVAAELATTIAIEAKLKAETATRIAEDAVKSKQQFLSNMSHEIRTPMNAIIGFTKVMQKTELSAKQTEYLSAIKMSGDALIVLINDILDLAKVDAGKLSFEKTPFRMALSISAMLHLFEPKIEEKNLKLLKEYDPNIPEVLLGDSVRLHQIIMNLLSNAVKFTATGEIALRVALLHEDAENATIEFVVSDTGIGIEQRKLETIFEVFQQASSATSRLFGGTGLGLAIVKKLVEQQGGFIQVTSTVGKGSTFSFSLTFQKTNDEVIVEVVNEFDSKIKQIKVLVVEDMVLNQLLMKTVLDEFGFQNDIAKNGKIAIEKMQANQYDIVLMDLQMPEMNGFEATEYIRKTMNSTIPIIALTADVTTVDLEKCKAAGMNDYIAKPVDEKLLYNKVVGLFKKAAFKNARILPVTIPVNNLLRCIDLKYMNQQTKSNPILMKELIAAYLEQTPPLLTTLRQSWEEKNWESLYHTAHKMLPSFSIVGINSDFEMKAKKIQEFAKTQLEMDGIQGWILEIENVCNQACRELQEELHSLKI
jgi:signal transduction histidine kinase/CheY-like chemotaxis protein